MPIPDDSTSGLPPAPQWFGEIIDEYRAAVGIAAPERRAIPRRQRQPRAAVPGGLLTAAQAAATLNCSVKTLNAHVDAGELRYVIIGHGKKRPRRFFTEIDLDAFITNQARKDTPCPSTASRARHTGISTSSGTVIDFTAPRKPPTDDKRKK